MTANLAEAQERREEVELLTGEFLLRLNGQQFLLGAFKLGAVQGFLFALDFAEKVFLDAVGQVAGDLALGAAQEEWPNAGGKAPAGEGISLGIVEAGELGAAAENAGHGKGHEAP